jgi:hypothetical protein
VTSKFVRRHINQLSAHELFTTGDFLNYGSRCSVDQILSRLVREGVIFRISPGVFARTRQREYTNLEIRAAKIRYRLQLAAAQ